VRGQHSFFGVKDILAIHQNQKIDDRGDSSVSSFIAVDVRFVTALYGNFEQLDCTVEVVTVFHKDIEWFANRIRFVSNVDDGYGPSVGLSVLIPPSQRWSEGRDSCRILGSMELFKIQVRPVE
jgi:hypothetical protein